MPSLSNRGPARRGWSIVLSAVAGVAMPISHATAADGDTDAPAAPLARAGAARAMLAKAAIAQMGETGQGASLCFVSDPTPEQLDNIMTRFQALPPTISGFGSRYFTSNTVWTGNGAQGSSGTATKANLTVSFPADGTTWGDGQNGPSAPNNLRANFQTLFGVGNEDHGFELIRQALVAWSRHNGLTYTEVADDNSAFTRSTTHVTTRGDIRIGSNPQGTGSGVLAYNQFPAGSGTGGSDMTINSDWFPVGLGALGSNTNNYRYLRNVVAHEHGHGLGFIHPVPCNQTKLMEPFASVAYETTQVDERRGAGRNYGDRRAGNSSGANAFDWGNLTTPIVKSVIERNLSTNGTGVADWFKFTLDSSQAVTISAAPLGGSYSNGQQSGGCNGSTSTINAGSAGNLNIELRNGTNGATVLQTAASAAAGSTETLSAGTLAAGTYWVRVNDSANSGNQIVQLYDLTMRVGGGGGAKAPPVAIAGFSKRVLAGSTCFLIGDLNSYTTDTGPGGGGNALAYSWDLDNNGTFGGGFDSNASEPVMSLPSNGTYPVTLRVTDSNGLSATDTIQVTVYGGNASILSVVPSNVDPGVQTPVVISGTNFKGISNATQFTVSGAGVTFTGTPVVNFLGTQVTGLNVVVAAGTPAGVRDVSVTNSDASGTSSGNATAAGLLSVTGGCAPPVILAQPQPRPDRCVGDTVMFNVGATGGPFTYQWRRNGTPLANSNSSVYSVTNVSAASTGLYDVVVTNSCGPTVSNAVILSIDTSGITSQPSSQTVCEGGTAVFTVGASGTVDYQWQKDGNDVVNANGPDLIISPVTQASVGSYTCLLYTNCADIVTSAATLTIGGSLAVGTQPQSQTVCEGATVSLTFGVAGATSFQWRKGGVDISGANNSTLEFDPITMGDGGDYDCVATGDCANATSNLATLTVCSTVSIDVGGQPASVSTCRGGSASLSVGVTGAGLSYQWRKGGVDISGATSPSLSFNPVSSADEGSYDCVITNCCQQVTSSAATVSVCAADFNCSGTVNVQDIFDFLNAWFAGNPLADFNGINGLSVQDIFDFLNSWFLGC